MMMVMMMMMMISWWYAIFRMWWCFHSAESSRSEVGRHRRKEWSVLCTGACERTTSNTHAVQDALPGLGKSLCFVSMHSV